MENSKQNQESELRDLSHEEMMSLFGGVNYVIVYVDGEIIYLEVDDWKILSKANQLKKWTHVTITFRINQ